MSAPGRGPLRFARWLVWTPAGLVVLGALLRLAFDLTKQNRYYFGDTADYEAIARHMLGKGAAPSLPRAPLFPAVMALGFLIGGLKNYAACRLVELPFGVALIAVIMRIARRLGDARTMKLAGLATALAPTLVFTSVMLYPTSLYTLLLACATLGALALAERPRRRVAVATGVAMALGWLTDAVFLAPALAILLWLLVRTRRGGQQLLAAIAIAVASAAAVAAPYLLVRRFSAATPEVTAGKAQWILYDARSDTSFNAARWIKLPPGQTFQPQSTLGFVRSELTLLARRPVDYVHDWGWEFLHFFAPLPDRITTRNRYNQPAVLWLGVIYFTPVLVLTLIALVRRRRGPPGRALLVAVVLATAMFYACFFTQTRYRVPVEPELNVLAAIGLAGLLPQRRGGSAR